MIDLELGYNTVSWVAPKIFSVAPVSKNENEGDHV
jgi:hypothetical protein